MDSSKLIKFAIGVAILMGIVAAFVDTSASKTEDVADVAAVEISATPDEQVAAEPEKVIRSTRREKKPTMSKASKEARARRADELEREPADYGERGLPPTDSVETKVVRKRKK